MEEIKTFKIILNKELQKNNTKVKVATEPKHKYNKWYHKILNKLTYGKKFVEGWEHEVYQINKDGCLCQGNYL